ncbi:MAG: bacillithiol biosynthesis BshC [Fibrobacteria bacterium]|nr:bacillithiol biosynthesis BshC [Fibrobacteria bacterium]
MKFVRAGSRVHPCAPWFLENEALDRLFPGGRGAGERNLLRRQKLLESWVRPRSWTALAKRMAKERPGSIAAIEGVGRGDAVVLTGQQPVVAGGPLFVWLKAWTAIAQARRATQLLGRPVRALFWIAGDDADRDEMRTLADPLLARVFDAFDDPPGTRGKPVGIEPLKDDVRASLSRRLVDAWQDEHLGRIVRDSPDLSSLLSACLFHWFGDELLVVDAAWPETRACAVNTYSSVAAEARGVHADLSVGIERARAAGLTTSIASWSDRARLFRFSPESRDRVRWIDDHWQGGSDTWDEEEFSSFVSGNPTLFSHDVASRPFAAEEVFPVLSHVLGPGELAYFACLGPLSARLGILAPVVARASATLLPTGPWPLAKEVRWDPVGSPAGSMDEMRLRLLEGRSPRSGIWPKLWSDARADYLQMLGEGGSFPGLTALSGRLERFEARFRRERLQATAPLHQADLAQLHRLVQLSGAGGPQERVWSPWALARHFQMPDLLVELAKVLDPLDSCHPVLEMRS